MTEGMEVVKTDDGTYKATVGGMSKTFPDIYLAVEWATVMLYNLEGEKSG